MKSLDGRIRQAIISYVTMHKHEHDPHYLIHVAMGRFDEWAVRKEIWHLLADGHLELTWGRKFKAARKIINEIPY